jgi:murein DD-endopeptidase MepM/ murein hydrolase activator NlpD
LHPDDVVALVDGGFGHPTSYGDRTKDGVDIRVKDIDGYKVPVLAVDDGVIIQSNIVNDAVGWEVHLDLGRDVEGKRVRAQYVHLTEALPIGTRVDRGQTIGFLGRRLVGARDRWLFFGIRVGDTPRYEYPDDGNPGDEQDIYPLMRRYARENGMAIVLPDHMRP